MRRFRVNDLPLSGLKLLESRRLDDQRGFLTRLFCAEELKSAGWLKPVSQVNHTYTARRGAVRGMHFQNPPHAEMKIVYCLRGEAWDVAVDLRAGSPTFLQWHAERLSAENGCALLIPEGFAHGFQALTDEVEMLYFHSAPYAAAAEGGLHPKDPCLGISWPLAITELSARDASRPFIKRCFEGVVV